MAMQAPNLNFVQYGSPLSDATSMYFATAQAAAQRRAEEQRQAEAERHNRDIEARDWARIGADQTDRSLRIARDAEDRENARYKAFSDFTRLSDESSPDYDPAAAALIQQRYGLQRSDEQAQLPERPQEDPRLGQQRQTIEQMQATEAQQRAAGPDQYADPDAAGAFSPAISDDLNRARGQLTRDEAAYAKQVKDWEALPRTTGRKVITDAEGRSFIYDPKAQAQAREAAEKRVRQTKADSYMQLAQSPILQSPAMKMAAATVSAGIGTGAIPVAKGDEWMKTLLTEQNDITAATIANNARVAIAGMKAKKGGVAKKPDKTQSPELDVLDEEGNVKGKGRSTSESKALREKRDELEKAKVLGEELKAHLLEHGRLSPIFSNEQGTRDAIISGLVETRKSITGAMNEADEQRYKKQLDTAFTRSPEAAVKAVDQFVNNLRVTYQAKTKSVMVGGTAPGKPTTAGQAPLKDNAARAKGLADKLRGRK